MMIEPIVSVIVPVYNAENTLRQALDSVKEQTLEDLEVICVNDGSTDSSSSILEEYAAQDDRFRIIDKKNAGYGAACNDGIGQARGIWIAILEPDDWIEPEMYQQMVEFAEGFEADGTSVDVIKTPYWRIVETTDKSGNVTIKKLSCSYKGWVNPKKQPFGLSDAPALFAHHPSIWSALYRRDYLNDKNIRFPEHAGAGWADNRFLADTLLNTNSIIYLDQAFYGYRADAPDKEKANAAANPMMPLERWNEMMDVIEAAGVTNPKILGAQYRRGFTYLHQLDASGALEDTAVQDEACRMLLRMDPRIVAKEPSISPKDKQLAFEAHGLASKKAPQAPYYSHLAKKALKRFKEDGVIATLRDVRNYS